MDFPYRLKQLDGISIMYFKGCTLSFPNYDVFLSQRIVFTLTNSADPDKMPHHAAFYLGLHWLSKYLFRGFEYTKCTG